MTIGIIDYGMANLRSVQKAFEQVGAHAQILSHPDQIAAIDRLVLPGVGAFADGMTNLRKGGWVSPIKTFIERGWPFLGICLGMQLLFDSSTEDATSDDAPVSGLGVLPGRVVKFEVNRGSENGKPASRIKVPHMGWNTLRWAGDDPLLAGLPQDCAVYFVHSYYCVPDERDDTNEQQRAIIDPQRAVTSSCTAARITSATTEYPAGAPFTSTICTGNLWATQFHPEKSQRIGLHMLRNFATLTVPSKEAAASF